MNMILNFTKATFPYCDYSKYHDATPSDMHKLTMSCFGTAHRNFTFSYEKCEDDLILYMQSVARPILYKEGCWQIKQIMDSFYDWDIFQMVVKLNPITRKDDKIVPLLEQEQMIKWFISKFNGGIEVLENSVEVEKLSPLIFENKGHKITLNVAKFVSIIRVSKEKNYLLKEIHKNGIGRGRAWGLGMVFLTKAIDKDNILTKG